MYTLGIPNRQKRRALGYLTKQWVDFEEHPSDEGFIELRFPGMDDENFRDISNKLKQQGVTLIGVDTQLTERKIMKLTDLLKEDTISGMEASEASVIEILKHMLRKWSQTQYMDDKQRGDDFFLDVKEMIEDFEEQEVLDYPTHVQNVNLREQKIRKLIQKLIREDNFDSGSFDDKLKGMMGDKDFDKATNPNLSKLIANSIKSMNGEVSHIEFAEAVSNVLRDEFGNQDFKPFVKHLTQNLNQM
jgi:predicted peroxiredoxin